MTNYIQSGYKNKHYLLITNKIPLGNTIASIEIRKAKAPSPPSMKSTNNAATNDKFYIQLTQDDKLYTDESSYC